GAAACGWPGPIAAPGGGSSGPLRPHPARASVPARARAIVTRASGAGETESKAILRTSQLLKIRVTIQASPAKGEIGGAPTIHHFPSFSRRLSHALACART